MSQKIEISDFQVRAYLLKRAKPPHNGNSWGPAYSSIPWEQAREELREIMTCTTEENLRDIHLKPQPRR